MAEPDASQIFAKALPLIAVVFMASGIVVKSIPLESRRPVDPERVKLSHAGRQDIEARLWEDPFTAMRHVKGRSPEERCKEALEDRAHHPDALHKSIAYRAEREHAVSVLPVMVSGGPYFEDGEARRRSRYAVVFALLQSGWTPASEDKLGYVWTLESCAEAPWARLAPELLPYEWFRFNAIGEDAAGETGAARRHLLVLWVDEDAIERRPLHGIERIVERLALDFIPCTSVSGAAGVGKTGGAQPARRGKLCVRPGKPLEAKGCGWPNREMAFEFDHLQKRPAPWCETRVIGPGTSSTLHRLAHELAQSSKSVTTADWLRFYSSGATAALDLQSVIDDVRLAKAGGTDKPVSVDALRTLFTARVVRLTSTDDRLTKAFETELGLRLVDPTPFWRVARLLRDQNPLCASTVVLVSEGDSSYARDFQRDFQKRFSKCRDGGTRRVVPVRYLRGLDGVLPEGAATPVPAAAGQNARAPGAPDTLLDPIALERADGRSQYDYLRRLARQLADIDRDGKLAGRDGVRAIGVLGNDAYDKLLVLDALRSQFPQAVFFAADLDARLIGGGGVRSTRNLVVASAYGLSLNPGIQGEAPPFRDTYQTGIYLSSLVALHPEEKKLSTQDFEPWFKEPQLFEIGRTRAVPLSKGAVEECSVPPHLKWKCANIHALDEWRDATPSPGVPVLAAFAVMAASAAGLVLLLSQRARKMVSSVRQAASGPVVLAALFLVVLLFTLGLAGKIIWNDASSGQGEPFAWLEGVSTWPTQILRLGIFMLTIALLDFGRWQLRRSIDKVAEHFGLKTLTAQEATPFPTIRGWKAKFRWLWYLETKDAGASEGTPEQTVPWIEYLDHARFGPSTTRIVLTSAIFFAFSLALMSLAWPHSPHRGELAAFQPRSAAVAARRNDGSALRGARRDRHGDTAARPPRSERRDAEAGHARGGGAPATVSGRQGRARGMDPFPARRASGLGSELVHLPAVPHAFSDHSDSEPHLRRLGFPAAIRGAVGDFDRACGALRAPPAARRQPTEGRHSQGDRDRVAELRARLAGRTSRGERRSTTGIRIKRARGAAPGQGGAAQADCRANPRGARWPVPAFVAGTGRARDPPPARRSRRDFHRGVPVPFRTMTVQATMIFIREES